MSFGNCGNPDKLAEFMRIIETAKRSKSAVGVHFIIEHDPFTKEKFKLSKEDLNNLKYDYIDIYLRDERLVQWWDIISCAIIYEI